MASSSTTRSEPRLAAADEVTARVEALATGLGTPALPAPWLAALRAGFARPLDDPAYADNALCPGGWPVETSFAETAPGALRLDLAPLDPAAPAADRLAAALALAQVPDAALAPWRDAVRPHRFGAFASVVVFPRGAVGAGGRGNAGSQGDAGRLGGAGGQGDTGGRGGAIAPVDADGGHAVTAKAYLELDPDAALRALPGAAGRLAAGLAAHVPGLRPHLVALSPAGGSRVYLNCASGLRLLVLADWAAGHGLAAAAPALLDTVRRLAGGHLVLAEPGVLLAVRDTGSGRPELKVEVTSAALADGDLVGPLLVDRPAGLAGYRRWRAATAGEVTVVSVRIGGDAGGPRLNAYAGLLPRRTP